MPSIVVFLSITILLLALALASVFLIAGIAKLLDLGGTRDALINFGVPVGLASPAKFLLPVLEIAIAIGLLVPATMWWSALAALFLLLAFIISIARSIQKGETHECHCFGQLYSRPLGWSTLLRNGVFAAIAVVIAWQTYLNDPSVLASRFNVQPAALIGCEFVVLALAGITSVVLHSRIRRQTEATAGEPKRYGLPVGTPAPAFELAAYRGPRRSLQSFLEAGKPVMLIFANPKCGPCAALFLDVGEWQRKYHEQITIAIVSQGTIKENFVNVARNGLENVLLQSEREVAEVYQALVTPVAIVVSPDGIIASEGAPGSIDIHALLHRFVSQHADDEAASSRPVASSRELAREGR